MSLSAISIKSWKICEFLLTSALELDFEGLDQLLLEREKSANVDWVLLHLPGRAKDD